METCGWKLKFSEAPKVLFRCYSGCYSASANAAFRCLPICLPPRCLPWAKNARFLGYRLGYQRFGYRPTDRLISGHTAQDQQSVGCHRQKKTRLRAGCGVFWCVLVLAVLQPGVAPYPTRFSSTASVSLRSNNSFLAMKRNTALASSRLLGLMVLRQWLSR